MPTITAQTIVDKAEALLLDTTNVRWSASELLGWLNDGQRAIVTLRPDAYVRTASMAMASGTKQSLPSDGYQLIKVIRNTGSGGTTPGKVVRQAALPVQDAVNPDWHGTTSAAVIDQFFYDPRAPRTFWVYPPSNGTTQIEIHYSASPPDVAAIGNVITLDDIYSVALLDYVLYRAYTKQTDAPGSGARAVAHYQAFEQGLGLKAQADSANMARAA